MTIKFKVFSSYHKEADSIDSSWYVPIQVGSSLTKERFGYLLDSDGENISNKNPYYCELTAQYWVWKNYDINSLDYVGFMHYRRHLSFEKLVTHKEDIYGLVSCEKIDEDYCKKFGLTCEKIEKVIDGYDVITVKRWDVRSSGSNNNLSHYAKSEKTYISDYENAISILLNMYPEYAEAERLYNESHLGYYTNIFIMTVPLFRDYSNWLFSILKALEEKVDLRLRNTEESRVFGYISEWLFGIYITNLKSKKKKILELQRTFTENCFESLPGKKITIKKNSIVTSCDNAFVPYASALIESIKSTNEEYDIYILGDRITEQQSFFLHKQSTSRVSVSVLDIKRHANIVNLPTHMHFSPAIYSRLLIPEIFEGEKILLYRCRCYRYKQLERVIRYKLRRQSFCSSAMLCHAWVL